MLLGMCAAFASKPRYQLSFVRWDPINGDYGPKALGVWSATLPQLQSPSSLRPDAYAVIHGRPNPLLAAKVTFSCLNRDVP